MNDRMKKFSVISSQLYKSLLVLTLLAAAQVATWTSDIYEHFSPPKIVREDDIVRYVFHCKRCVFILGVKG
jgi:hypothetical protein